MFLAIIGRILAYGSSIYALILIARVIFDWVRILAPRWVPSGPVLFIADWVYRLTDPPIVFLRRYIPPLRVGNIALDVGFLVLFVGVAILGRFGDALIVLAFRQ